MSRVNTDQAKWAIVLAGGNGERMQESIYRWLGEYHPKQFCAFVGTRSMLEHTLDRAKEIVGNNIVTVAVEKHSHYFNLMCRQNKLPGKLIFQPENYGTAPAIFLALAYIRAQSPDASVIILPSDHFISPEQRFIKLAISYMNRICRYSTYMAIMGAEATSASNDFGWITFSQDDDFQLVDGFFEKPNKTLAEQIYQKGGLWSTMITMAKAKYLWRLGHRVIPSLITRMDRVHRVLSSSDDSLRRIENIKWIIDKAFYGLSNYDFSHDVISPNSKQCLVVPMKGIEWDDWGSPERICETIRRHKLSPISKFVMPESGVAKTSQLPKNSRSIAV